VGYTEVTAGSIAQKAIRDRMNQVLAGEEGLRYNGCKEKIASGHEEN
jgi:hypothetical protein